MHRRSLFRLAVFERTKIALLLGQPVFYYFFVFPLAAAFVPFRHADEPFSFHFVRFYGEKRFRKLAENENVPVVLVYPLFIGLFSAVHAFLSAIRDYFPFFSLGSLDKIFSEEA